MAIGLTMCWKQAHRGANFPKFWRDIIFCLKFYTKQTVKQHGDEGKKKPFQKCKVKIFFSLLFLKNVLCNVPHQNRKVRERKTQAWESQQESRMMVKENSRVITVRMVKRVIRPRRARDKNVDRCLPSSYPLFTWKSIRVLLSEMRVNQEKHERETPSTGNSI